MSTPAPRDPQALVIIANPAAGRGRAARLLRRLEARLGAHPPHVLQLTSRAGDETRLAREAAAAGAGTILAVGGDGTWGNVVRGIMTSGAARLPRLALMAAGTGNDLAYATGVPAHDLEAALAIARGPGERAIDVGEVDGVHFVNCAGFGFDAEVLRATQGVRWLRGHAVYLVTAARKLFGYGGFEATLAAVPAGGAAPPAAATRARHLMIVLANGARFGGGFLIAPAAQVDDGALDLVRVADLAPWRRLAVLAGASRGAHLAAPEVSLQAVREVTLAFAAPPTFNADGELHQARSARVTVRCHAGALRLAVSA